jgi:hypothetical protein
MERWWRGSRLGKDGEERRCGMSGREMGLRGRVGVEGTDYSTTKLYAASAGLARLNSSGCLITRSRSILVRLLF